MGWIRIHGGLNWDWSNKLSGRPYFANFRLSPKIGEETKLHSTWTWKSDRIGSRQLNWNYKKSLGVQTYDDILLFY
jgi:hypothetical protein